MNTIINNIMPVMVITGIDGTLDFVGKSLIALLVTLIALILLSYLIEGFILGLWLKKSNIKNWGLAFVPFANLYKQLHYMYDVKEDYRQTEEESNETINKVLETESNDLATKKDYIEKRRTFSLKAMLLVIVLSFLIGIIGSILGTISSENFEGVTQFFTTLLSSAVSIVIIYGMFRTVVKTEVEAGTVKTTRNSKVKSIVFAVISVATFNIFYWVCFTYYIYSKEHKYILANTLNERELDNVVIRPKEDRLVDGEDIEGKDL